MRNLTYLWPYLRGLRYPAERSTACVCSFVIGAHGAQPRGRVYQCKGYTSLRLIISKILRAKSSFSSLSPLYYSDIVALLYKKLDIGSQSVFIAFLPYCHTLYTSLCLIISKIVQAKSPLSSLSPPYYGNIVALLYGGLGIIGSRLVLA